MTHDELRDLASLYALDALTGSDRVEFEEHLGGCAECTQLVREYREAATSFAYTVPGAEPSTALKERVMAHAQGTARKRLPSPWIPLAVAASLIVALFAGVVAYQNYEKNRFMETAAVAQVSGSTEAPGAKGKVFYQGNRVLFMASDLPDPPHDRAYQLWALVGNRAIPAGTYHVDSSGEIRSKFFDLPEAVTEVSFAVTVEPKDGSETPTMPMYLVPGK